VGSGREKSPGPRHELQARLAGRGVETLIHYPIPLPRQPAFAATQPDQCPIAMRVCDEVLSLPLHPGLAESDVYFVAALLEEHDACVR
jgi:dTDP-4-amino-4,6-dideoxygalactose transaminase